MKKFLSLFLLASSTCIFSSNLFAYGLIDDVLDKERIRIEKMIQIAQYDELSRLNVTVGEVIELHCHVNGNWLRCLWPHGAKKCAAAGWVPHNGGTECCLHVGDVKDPGGNLTSKASPAVN